MVHLDVLPADIDNSYSPSVELIGDIAATLQLLIPQISHSTPEPSIKRLLENIAQDREELARSSTALNGTPVHPLRLVSELQKILTPDTTLCLDMGSFHLWMARHLYSFRARQILISNGQQDTGCSPSLGDCRDTSSPCRKGFVDFRRWWFSLFPRWSSKPRCGLQSNLVHMIWI